MHFCSRRRFIEMALVNASLGVIGCGTILHPERRGQAAGPLDWKIVALDAVGLFFFFIPGVIAFAVDFNNGSIYLPPEQHGQRPRRGRRTDLVTVKVPRDQLNTRKIEEVVSNHVEQPIELKAGTYQMEEIDHVDEFWTAADRVSAD